MGRKEGPAWGLDGEHGQEARSSLSKATLWTGRSLYWVGGGGGIKLGLGFEDLEVPSSPERLQFWASWCRRGLGLQGFWKHSGALRLPGSSATFTATTWLGRLRSICHPGSGSSVPQRAGPHTGLCPVPPLAGLPFTSSRQNQVLRSQEQLEDRWRRRGP